MVLKKKFFEVDVPLTNTKAEMLAYNIEDLDNRTVKLDLTRQLRGKSIEVVFRVNVENEKPIAKPIKLTLLPFFIRRMLRKNISYVEDSFSAECKDAYLRVKPFLITRKKVSRNVRKALREEAKAWLTDYIKTKDCMEIFSEIIGNRLQKPLSLKLKKIYPLALCEIRMLLIESEKEQEKIKVTVEKIDSKPNEKVTKGKLKPEETVGVLGKDKPEEETTIEEKPVKKTEKPKKEEK